MKLDKIQVIIPDKLNGGGGYIIGVVFWGKFLRVGIIQGSGNSVRAGRVAGRKHR